MFKPLHVLYYAYYLGYTYSSLLVYIQGGGFMLFIVIYSKFHQNSWHLQLRTLMRLRVTLGA